jgi:hypothetical protein
MKGIAVCLGEESKSCCKMSRALSVVATLWLAAALAQAQVVNPIMAPTQPNTPVVGLNTTAGVVHAKASPDECWNEVTTMFPLENEQYQFMNLANPSHPCAAGQIPKVNQGYVWGAALAPNGHIYFGTAPNGQCVTEGGITATTTPYQNPYWACEFQDGAYAQFNGGPLPNNIADNRVPREYDYNIATQALTEITPLLGGTPPKGYCGTPGPIVFPSVNPLCVDRLWLTLRGVRATTVYTEPATGYTYVLVSGPALVVGNNGLDFFAYDITPGSPTQNKWVGEFQLPGYNDQRHWVINNATGVPVYYAPSGQVYQGGPGGHLLRFRGNFAALPPLPTPSAANNYGQIPNCGQITYPYPQGAYACFAFEDVGNFDGVGTDATNSQGRIFVANWPEPGAPAIYAGIWMSPPIDPVNGLTSANAGQWTKIWNPSQYEPDPVQAVAYATGALMDFGGYLYWGTMNVPYQTFFAWEKEYENLNGGLTPPQSLQQSAVGDTFRAISLFRSNNLTAATPTIQLLYGYQSMEAFNYTTNTFTLTPNVMGGVTPLYGGPGFGNPYNMYTWSMNTWNNRLYVGTMDWGFLAATEAFVIAGVNITQLIPTSTYGADLYYFPNTSSKAVVESSNGVGNYLNYGVRNIIPYTYPNGSISMFIGSANAMNLATVGSPALSLPPAGPCDVPSGQCLGGWELIELKPASQVVKR